MLSINDSYLVARLEILDDAGCLNAQLREALNVCRFEEDESAFNIKLSHLPVDTIHITFDNSDLVSFTNLSLAAL